MLLYAIHSPPFVLEIILSQESAVGIKEDARELRNVIASLGGLDEEKILNKKASYSFFYVVLELIIQIVDVYIKRISIRRQVGFCIGKKRPCVDE